MIERSLIVWLREKLTEAESALRAREQMEQTFRSGSDSDWKTAAEIHGDKFMTKADRLKEADAQRRISVRCRRDVDMFTLILTAVASD